MKFYGREKELALMQHFFTTVKNKGSRILVITGRRRIGKTRLVLESAKNKDYLYFFTKKKKINEIISEWSNEIKNKYGEVFYGNFVFFEDFLKFLFDFSKKKPIILIFDEVQNLLYSDPSAFGTFQKIFDLNKEKANVLLVFLGSSFSLMERIFKNSKEPLFGRASEIIRLSYLPLKIQSEILKDNGFSSGKNLLHLFSIFDGIPKYIEELMDLEKKSFDESIRELITERDFIWEEGENLIKEEFGREYSSYFSILSAVSKGRRRLNEIEQFTGIRDVGSYLKNLEEIYRMINRRLPVTSKSIKERNGRYYLNDNFLDFWFRFIESKRMLKEAGKADHAFMEIWNELPIYEGRKLEDLVIRKMIEENPLDIRFSKAGKYWNRKGDIEIDAMVLDDDAQKAYMFEVKTNKAKITKNTMENLKRKGQTIFELENYELITKSAYIGDEDVIIE
ncbi:MAG: ATP-binding protein [Actinobacteria bacterium]|nr:ATP-binding protein [Actinomycetota bacterium]